MVANLEGDFTRSVSFFEAALHSAPNEASNHNWMAMALDGLGRYRESLRWFQQARDLDPLVRIYWSNGLRCLARLRRTQAWLLESARMDEVLGARDYPGRFSQRFSLTGELSATPDTYQELILARDYKGALERIAATLAESDKLAEEHWELLLRKADCLRWTGRETEAELALREAEAWMERANAIPDRHDAVPEMRRMLTWARMGRAADAVAAGRRYVAGAHPELQADWRWLREIRLATVHALLGQPRECVELLDRLLKVPSGLTVPMLKIDPIWDRVRDDPGFKALLEDPRNSAPL